MERVPGTEYESDRILVEHPHNIGLERRVSRKSSRPSTHSLRLPHPSPPKEHEHDHAPPRPPSPQRNGGHHRHTSSPIILRRRLTPSIHKHDVAHSPLAQVFQPLVLDDVHAPEDTVSDNVSGSGVSASLPQPQLSYGPATRHRLGPVQSVQKRPSQTSLWAPRPAVSGRPAYPPLDTREETLAGRLSASSGHQDEEERPIATAEQVEEIVEGNGGMTEWMKRMEKIERQQERIEDLLVQLHARMQCR